jgi:hypothetical protein
MSEIELLKGVRVFDISQGMAQGKNNQMELILSLSFMPYALCLFGRHSQPPLT